MTMYPHEYVIILIILYTGIHIHQQNIASVTIYIRKGRKVLVK